MTHFERRQLQKQTNALEVIARVFLAAFDHKKKAIRMVDVDRAKVYGKHLGKKLRSK